VAEAGFGWKTIRVRKRYKVFCEAHGMQAVSLLDYILNTEQVGFTYLSLLREGIKSTLEIAFEVECDGRDMVQVGFD
jgi:hypothetical protein